LSAEISASEARSEPVKRVKTDGLWIAYVEHGPINGWPVILSQGFPYDVHAYDEVASILAQVGARVIAPYTRGFGPTRFVSAAVMRSGQQAARGCDIVQLADALGMERPILAGFDWGGNASCVAAALWPDRIGGVVSYAGYDVIDVSQQWHPVAPQSDVAGQVVHTLLRMRAYRFSNEVVPLLQADQTWGTEARTPLRGTRQPESDLML